MIFFSMNTTNVIELVGVIISAVLTISIFILGFAFQKRNELKNDELKAQIENNRHEQYLQNLKSELVNDFDNAGLKLSEGMRNAMEIQLISNYSEISSKVHYINMKKKNNEIISKEVEELMKQKVIELMFLENSLLDLNVQNILQVFNNKFAALDKYFSNEFIKRELDGKQFNRIIICSCCNKAFNFSDLVNSIYESKETFKIKWHEETKINSTFSDEYNELFKNIQNITRILGFGMIEMQGNSKVFDPVCYLVPHD